MACSYGLIQHFQALSENLIRPFKLQNMQTKLDFHIILTYTSTEEKSMIVGVQVTE